MTSLSPVHGDKLKAATCEQWSKAAESWDQNGPKIRNWLGNATDAMLNMANVRSGARVLDVAAGAGDQTLEIARRIGPTGFVLATDLSAAILRFAEINACRAGFGNIEFRVADGENLQIAEAIFDAAICRLGLMFFPDPSKGLREMLHALKPGGMACTLVFSAPEENPCIGILIATALKHARLPPRDPYQPGGLLSLGKPGLIDKLFRRAGFARVATTKLSAPFRLPSVRDYLSFVQTSASPILQILDSLDKEAKDAAWAEIEEKLSAFTTTEGWEGPNQLLLTAGRRE
jgi:ubiquinone/menaquinone biosynthesis C-methylase UbiE